MLRAALGACLRYQFVEEEKIRATIQQLGTLGEIIDPGEALQIGKALEATYVIVGTVTRVAIGPETVEVGADVQVVKTDTGAIVASPYRIGRAKKGMVRATIAELAKTTFYGEEPVAKLLRDAASDLVKRLAVALKKTF